MNQRCITSIAFGVSNTSRMCYTLCTYRWGKKARVHYVKNATFDFFLVYNIFTTGYPLSTGEARIFRTEEEHKGTKGC